MGMVIEEGELEEEWCECSDPPADTDETILAYDV